MVFVLSLTGPRSACSSRAERLNTQGMITRFEWRGAAGEESFSRRMKQKINHQNRTTKRPIRESAPIERARNLVRLIHTVSKIVNHHALAGEGRIVDRAAAMHEHPVPEENIALLG